MKFLRDRPLSPAARDLIDFDMDSIRRLGGEPDVWLADPDQYEKNGRPLRDSESPRMLAYSREKHVLYATDGCNSCSRRLPVRIETLPGSDLRRFADENELRPDLLMEIVRLVNGAS